MNFSNLNRSEIVHQLENTEFDILVIGGGITGVGIALDAASRGLKVALIEMQDFASGTSGRSTKLIHGGLRYLQQFDFKLVREVGRERKTILRNAAHLTKPELMLLPITKDGTHSRILTKIGMMIYELMAGVLKNERHKFLSKEETLLREKNLNSHNLIGSYLFYEYRTDDARLVTSVLKKAVELGAIGINYCKVEKFIYTKNKIKGVEALNLISKKRFTIQTKFCVNAGGPWVDQLDHLDNATIKNKLSITKGIHVVIDHFKLPVSQSVYFDTDDNRMIFVIPREGKTYIGTTDTFYHGNLERPEIKKEDCIYLLKCISKQFPSCQLTLKDIESAWAGLRPLIVMPGKGPSEISRKDELFISETGLITIAGGKLTGYRKMAQRVIDTLISIETSPLKELSKECKTEHIRLSGGDFESIKDLKKFINVQIIKGKQYSFSKEEVKTLVGRYGKNIDIIFNFCKELVNESNQIPLIIRSQIHYTVKHEMCVTVADFFVRRTSSFYFNNSLVKENYQEVEKYMAHLFLESKLKRDEINEELSYLFEELESLTT